MSNLTEKWKNRELEFGKEYYVRFEDGEIDTAQWCYYTNQDRYGFDVDEVKEVLAPVPSYEEWKSVCDDCNSMQETIFSQDSIYCENENLLEEIEKIDEENTKLKELLKECRTCVTRQIYGSPTRQYWEGVFDDELLTKIDEVLK